MNRPCPIRAQTSENRLVQESAIVPCSGADLQGKEPACATRRQAALNHWRCLGDKRSPVQIRAPRLGVLQADSVECGLDSSARPAQHAPIVSLLSCGYDRVSVEGIRRQPPRSAASART
jgi:hypothetical protein